jgi:hypothetical protein
MAINAGPKIVEDGLVFCVDAANKKSYPGAGTTWTDLTANKNNGTLTNGPTFDGANGGSIVFDGTNDYMDFYAPNLTTTTTVEMFCKIGSSYSNKMFFGWDRYDVWCGSSHLGFNTSNGDVYGISSTTVNNLGLVNNWKHYIFEMRSDVSYTNNKIYIDGILQSLGQQRGGEISSTRNFNNGNGRIAGWLYSNEYRMPMNLALFKVYNRALTPDEIRQNYLATKGRFQ